MLNTCKFKAYWEKEKKKKKYEIMAGIVINLHFPIVFPCLVQYSHWEHCASSYAFIL